MEFCTYIPVLLVEEFRTFILALLACAFIQITVACGPYRFTARINAKVIKNVKYVSVV